MRRSSREVDRCASIQIGKCSASRLAGRDALLSLATGPPGPWCAQHGNTTDHCNDPAYAASALRAVEIRVTLNGNSSDASPTAVVYLTLPSHLPNLNEIHPWGGPVWGGTLVNIVGYELLSLTHRAPPVCRFGNIDVPATVGGQNGVPALQSQVSAQKKEKRKKRGKGGS